MFKKGDIIKSKECKHNLGCYSKGLKKAKVHYVNGYPATMGIEVLEHEDKEVVGFKFETESREEWYEVIT